MINIYIYVYTNELKFSSNTLSEIGCGLPRSFVCTDHGEFVAAVSFSCDVLGCEAQQNDFKGQAPQVG